MVTTKPAGSGRTQESISSGSPSGIITYDSTGGYGDTTGFDRVGNRRSRSSNVTGVPAASYSYSSNDRLLTDGYDNNGNTTLSGSYAYTYDFENRLKTRNGTPALSFGYDHDGNRVSKSVDGATTYFLVDEQNPTGYPQVVEELSAIGASPVVSKVYQYGLRLVSQSTVALGVRSSTQYYGHDGHGSMRLLISV